MDSRQKLEHQECPRARHSDGDSPWTALFNATISSGNSLKKLLIISSLFNKIHEKQENFGFLNWFPPLKFSRSVFQCSSVPLFKIKMRKLNCISSGWCRGLAILNLVEKKNIFYTKRTYYEILQVSTMAQNPSDAHFRVDNIIPVQPEILSTFFNSHVYLCRY